MRLNSILDFDSSPVADFRCDSVFLYSMTDQLSQLQQVLIICLPVFLLLGLGQLLQRYNYISPQARTFISKLVYHFALPSLIFTALVSQPFLELINVPVIVASLSAVFVVAGLHFLLSRIFALSGGIAAAFIFGAFWANVSYIGFPLAQNSYGAEKGIALAGIIHAFVLPIFVALAFLIAFLHSPGGTGSLWKRIGGVFLNPVVLSAILGTAASALIGLIPEPFYNSSVGKATLFCTHIIQATLKLLGGMGLPLALISVGAGLHFSRIIQYPRLLVIIIISKLIILPLLTLLLLRFFFPQAEHEAVVVSVLLMATPLAAASAVVSENLDLKPDFVSAILVLSTAGSVLTLPAWLYFLY